MKRLLSTALVVAALVYGGWPYAYVYRIDTALTRSDHASLAKLIEIKAVRSEARRSMTRDVDTVLGGNQSGFVGWLKSQVNELGSAAVEEIVDLEWAIATLKPGTASFRSRITDTSFESWTSFVIRLGELGGAPVHVRLQLTDGNWRVVGIYP